MQQIFWIDFFVTQNTALGVPRVEVDTWAGRNDAGIAQADDFTTDEFPTRLLATGVLV